MAGSIAEERHAGPDDGGDRSSAAPEGSTGTGTALLLRAALAGLLVILVASIVQAAGTALPGEVARQSTLDAFQQRAASASVAADRALVDRGAATVRLDEARRAAVTASTGVASPRSLARARRERDLAKLDWQQSVALHEQLLAEEAAAFDDMLTLTSGPASAGSDLDLVRAIGAGVLAVVALLAAAMLLYPRRPREQVRRTAS